VAVLLACAGCDQRPFAADAGPGGQVDALFQALPCEPTLGRTYILAVARFLPEGMGKDLDGDGDIDNALSFLAPILNQVIEDAIAAGASLFLFDVAQWADPPTPDDPEVIVTTFAGIDADQPADPSNNLTGEGEFYFLGQQLDVNCQPLSKSERASITDGVISAYAPRWRFSIGNIGSIEFASFDLSWTFLDGYHRTDGLATGSVPLCSMSHAYDPQLGSGSLLDLVANQPTLRPADIDRDGDGYERAVGDGANGVKECIDGDGTVVPGADCACDPRFVDGYSMALELKGVRTKVLGILGPTL
jgi:hypothetical protein